MELLKALHQRMDLRWAILFMCVSVLMQMFSTLVTPLSLVNDFDMLTESDSEDPSILPPVLDIRPFNALQLQIDRHAILHLPMVLTSVFHPPLT